uniref:Uncharacterized protein n=1 Tax=Proboscia inermis TaxID=420281 RepID=A0A7S0CDJ4_9STRA
MVAGRIVSTWDTFTLDQKVTPSDSKTPLITRPASTFLPANNSSDQISTVTLLLNRANACAISNATTPASRITIYSGSVFRLNRLILVVNDAFDRSRIFGTNGRTSAAFTASEVTHHTFRQSPLARCSLVRGRE